MVITVKQMQKKALRVDKTKLKKLEQKIDSEIAKQFDPTDECGVCLELTGLILDNYDPLYKAIKQKYSQAGWVVKYELVHDQDYLRLTPRRGAR